MKHCYCSCFAPLAFVLSLSLYSSFSASQTTSHEADDFAISGSYHILYCNANSSANPQAAYLQALLPAVWISIQGLLRDIQRGITSRHGYAAFFKTNSNLDLVRQIYQDIADGPDTLTSAGPGTAIRPTPPTIICANPNQPDTVLLQQYCNDPVGYSEVVAGVPMNSGIVFLCPQFFHLPRIPRRAACPRVDLADNRFEAGDDGSELGKNQLAILVHEIAHIYLQERGLGGQEEVYGINGTVALNATASYKNAMNYAFYAAGKPLPKGLWERVLTVNNAAVQARCTEFPIPISEPGNDIHR